MLATWTRTIEPSTFTTRSLFELADMIQLLHFLLMVTIILRKQNRWRY
jgi:hypothetical protein